jgi:TolA-binding protein
MSRFRWIIVAIILTMGLTASGAIAFQGSVTRGPLEPPRDPALEKESLHNLEVARFYVKKKKWVAARSRLQDIVAKNPNFAGIAEVYFLLGEVYSKTRERDLAIELYSRVVEEFPQSEFAEKARARMQELGKEKAQSGRRGDVRPFPHSSFKGDLNVYTRGGIGRV